MSLQIVMGYAEIISIHSNSLLHNNNHKFIKPSDDTFLHSFNKNKEILHCIVLKEII